ncbi:uncharacterized protein [Phyllobates terribilis]|uniref:uncharacterized protein n=1 Tax=Phyllobates terribilis TaxID=111132 RepID=UPI003CCB363A
MEGQNFVDPYVDMLTDTELAAYMDCELDDILADMNIGITGVAAAETMACTSTAGETSETNLQQPINDAGVLQATYTPENTLASNPPKKSRTPHHLMNRKRKGGKLLHAGYAAGPNRDSKAAKRPGKSLRVLGINSKGRKLMPRKVSFSKENRPISPSADQRDSSSSNTPACETPANIAKPAAKMTFHTSTHCDQNETTTSALQPSVEPQNTTTAQIPLQPANGAVRRIPLSPISVIQQGGSRVTPKRPVKLWPHPLPQKKKNRTTENTTAPLPTTTPQIISTNVPTQQSREALDREIDQLADGKQPITNPNIRVCHTVESTNPGLTHTSNDFTAVRAPKRQARSAPTRSKRQKTDDAAPYPTHIGWVGAELKVFHDLCWRYIEYRNLRNQINFFCDTHERLFSTLPTRANIAELHTFRRLYADTASTSVDSNNL